MVSGLLNTQGDDLTVNTNVLWTLVHRTVVAMVGAKFPLAVSQHRRCLTTIDSFH